MRCPLDAIASLVSHAPSSREFQRDAGMAPASHMPTQQPWTLADKVAFGTLSWIEWNAHIERYADFRVTSEDLLSDVVGPKHLDQILIAAGLGSHARNVSAGHDGELMDGKGHMNQRPHVRNLTLTSLGAFLKKSHMVDRAGPFSDEVVSRVVRMARAYGFGTECLGRKGQVRVTDGRRREM